MESSNKIDCDHSKNPKLALLRRIKEQKGETTEKNLDENKSDPAYNEYELSAESESCHQQNLKKKHAENFKRPMVDPNNKMPLVSGAFLDEYEKSIKISDNNMIASKSELQYTNKSIPSAISLNDILSFETICKIYEEKFQYLRMHPFNLRPS